MDNELVKVEERNGIPTCNARELHEYLEVGTKYADWITGRIDKYEFIEGVDYTKASEKKEASRTGQISIEYYITLDMAKQLSMVENNDKGREARRYFIEAEKKLKALKVPALTGSLLIATALIEANTMLQEAHKQIEEMAPKAEFYDQVTDSRDTIDVGEAAKVLNMGMGRNTLFELLRRKKVLMDNNQPYQKYIDAGYFRTVETQYIDIYGATRINIKTIVFQKGLDFIRKIVEQYQEKRL